MREANCLLFVGIYRSNELEPDHPSLRLIERLEGQNVRCTKIHLDGMNVTNLNEMVSDSLGMLPGACRALSEVIYHKTKGNPFFAKAFINSLVDQGHLQYSHKERRWNWDADKISAENITDNVIFLLQNKISTLSNSLLETLRVASCFGTEIQKSVVECLNGTSAYSDFKANLKLAASEGFVTRSGSNSWVWNHDKVREAAYGLIATEERERLCFDIGNSMYQSFEEQGGMESTIFVICDLLNHGHEFIDTSQKRIAIAKLNQQASSSALRCSNFSAAYVYSKASARLLPEGNWEDHFDLSNRVFLSLANSSYACGHIDEAISAVNTAIEQGRSLEDKLQAYTLFISLLQSQRKVDEAYGTCLHVLSCLGECLPDIIDKVIFAERVDKIQRKMSATSDEDMLSMRDMTNNINITQMLIYSQTSYISYFFKPQMVPYIACRMMEVSRFYMIRRLLLHITLPSILSIAITAHLRTRFEQVLSSWSVTLCHSLERDE